MRMTKVEVAETLGQLIKLGLVEAVTEDGQPTRYRLAGRPVDDETESQPITLPCRVLAYRPAKEVAAETRRAFMSIVWGRERSA